MQSKQWSHGLHATVGGTGITSRAGTTGLRMLGDKVGLPRALTRALVGTTSRPALGRPTTRFHDNRLTLYT